MKVYYDKDADQNLLKGKKVAVIGYGSQGFAHSNNLKESGVDVMVGLRKGSKSWEKAAGAGLKVVEVAEAAKTADIIMILVPDELQGGMYRKDIEAEHQERRVPCVRSRVQHPFRPDRAARGRERVHGRSQEPRPPGAVPVYKGRGRARADRGPSEPLAAIPRTSRLRMPARSDWAGRASSRRRSGKRRRRTFSASRPCSAAARRRSSRPGTRRWSRPGTRPEMAYFECLHELKLIVDLIYEGGISNMRYSISNTAQYGDLTRGPRLVNEETKKEMKKILHEIQSGQFAKEWMLENMANKPTFNALTKKGQAHPIEEVGERLRKMMPWLQKSKLVDKSKN